MKLFAITVCHMEPEIMGMSLAKFLRTAGDARPDRWIMLDNHWPIRPENFGWCVEACAKMVGAEAIASSKNLGGHGGFNFALGHLGDYADQDLILAYDPDSNPVSVGWLDAMVAVMRTDRSLGYVSLMHDAIVKNRSWEFHQIGGHQVAFHPVVDMFNVTLFRGSVLKAAGGLRSHSPFYGNVEEAMSRFVVSRGMGWGYMAEHRETWNPVPHPVIYKRWKDAHGAGQYAGNFDQWLKEWGL